MFNTLLTHKRFKLILNILKKGNGRDRWEWKLVLKMKETDGSGRECRKWKRQMGVEGSVGIERDRWEWKGV